VRRAQRADLPHRTAQPGAAHSSLFRPQRFTPTCASSYGDVPPRAAWALEQAGVHPLLARLFAARGVRSADELDDGLARLLPPAGLQGH
jgi:hypothetical protein